MAENNKYDNSNIFRKKSLDKISSPEDLDRYIKTTTPSLWLLLISVILFLVGIIVWATLSTVSIESESTCNVSNGVVTCYITENRVESLKKDTYIEINNNKYPITKFNGPIEAEEYSYTAELHNSGIEKGTWYYEINSNCDLKDGKYDGRVVFEEINPISFVIN